MSEVYDPEKNPFGTGAENPGYDGDEIGENIGMREMDRDRLNSTRRDSKDTGQSSHEEYAETSFGGDIRDITPLIQRENELNDSVDIIKSKLPNADTSKFVSKIDEFGRVVVKLIRQGGKYHPLFNSDGEINEKLPKTIRNALGEPAYKITEANKYEIAKRENKMSELQENRKTATGAEKENIDSNINEQQDQMDALERENEEIEGRMSLRDRTM